MHPISAIPFLTLLYLTRPAVSLGNHKRAINPTAPGQIGVNPVDPLTDLGSPSKWWVFILSITQRPLMGVKFRIGVNTEYLTDLVEAGTTTTKVRLKTSHCDKCHC